MHVDVDALVFDLCGQVHRYSALLDVEPHGLSQAVGRAVHNGHHPGLRAPSARLEGGVNVDIFDPAYLSKPRDVCYLTYRYQPGGRVEVERDPGASWLRL